VNTLLHITCLALLAACLAWPPLFASDPWPGGPGTEIGQVGQGGLPSGYEPSGAAWHHGRQHLLVVSDDGYVSELDGDGVVVHTWIPGGDLEAIAVPDEETSLAYLGVEHPDGIREFDLDTGTLTGNSWDLTPWMTSLDGDGLEALTWVGDLVYAGHQGDGKIYVFQLEAGGAVSHIDTILPPGGREDISGLDYLEGNETLYALFKNDLVIVEMTSDGTFLREYTCAGDNQEGLALADDCPDETSRIFIAEDIGLAPEVWRYDTYPLACETAPGSLVVINEFMAGNDTVIEDPDDPGAYEDWIELRNTGDAPVNLGGMYLTDDLADPTQWQIPDGLSIPANGCILFWADDEQYQGDTHTSFKLSVGGEEVGLFDTDANGNAIIDSVSYGVQTTDVSQGRCPEEPNDWTFYEAPTPGTANAPCGGTITADLACQPASGTLPFSTRMSVTLTNCYQDQARRVAARLNVTLAGGQYYPQWRNGWTNLAAGDSFVGSWWQAIPALGSLVGQNSFQLTAQDVTPAPYNQPPYALSGDTDTAACTVTGSTAP